MGGKELLIAFILFPVAALILFLWGIRWISIKGKRGKGTIIFLSSILFVHLFLTIIIPEVNTYKSKAYENDSSIVKSSLYNLYLSCKDYWKEMGSDQNCPLPNPENDKYRFVQDARVSIEGGGQANSYSARASLKKSKEVYEINANGKIRLIENP